MGLHSEQGPAASPACGSLARRTVFAGHDVQAPPVGKATWAADGRGGGRGDQEQPGSEGLLSRCVVDSMKSTNELQKAGPKKQF